MPVRICPAIVSPDTFEPADGAEVLDELEALDVLDDVEPPDEDEPDEALDDDELLVAVEVFCVTVVLLQEANRPTAANVTVVRSKI